MHRVFRVFDAYNIEGQGNGLGVGTIRRISTELKVKQKVRGVISMHM